MIIQTITLNCDRCGEEADPSFPTVGEARRWGRQQGWRFKRNGEDICPDCATPVVELPCERCGRPVLVPAGSKVAAHGQCPPPRIVCLTENDAAARGMFGGAGTPPEER